MKKKMIGFTMAGLLLFGTGAWASQTGLYKDYVTVPVIVDGNSTTVQDVPAFNIDNRVVVPAYMLREAGVAVDMGGDGSLYIDVPESEPVVKTVTEYVYINVDTNEVIPPTLPDGSPNPVIPETQPVTTEPGTVEPTPPPAPPTPDPAIELAKKCAERAAWYDSELAKLRAWYQNQKDQGITKVENVDIDIIFRASEQAQLEAKPKALLEMRCQAQ